MPGPKPGALPLGHTPIRSLLERRGGRLFFRRAGSVFNNPSLWCQPFLDFFSNLFLSSFLPSVPFGDDPLEISAQIIAPC